MPPSRLSDVDKQEILELYQRGKETTTSLASRYGVSNSTVIRVLKSFLTPEAYETLVQSKRSNGREKASDAPSDKGDASRKSTTPAKKKKAPRSSASAPPDTAPPPPEPKRRSRKRSNASEDEAPDDTLNQLPLALDTSESKDLDLQTTPTQIGDPEREVERSAPILKKKTEPTPEDLAALETELLSEFKHAPTSLDEDDDDDLEDDDDEFDDEFDDEDGDGDDSPANFEVLTSNTLETYPLGEDDLPRTCYLVVDRTAELITRPLKEFGELGPIPDHEKQERILPIFDNHRVAKRFSNRNQRIIKVPDGQMLSRASIQLQAKGITRLLIDGRIYTLAD